ncbi:hypothetical protein [Solirubrobacter soli]|uniref:hypothetical protein n=1 Tax=Solirubrobacter soli TaxID=363832 RepID=UPI00040EDD3D|nr:hypothetical protein [Solirubrobacter soli]
MSTRTVLYALTIAVAMLTLPAAASARPLYDREPLTTSGQAVSSGPSPLLFVAAALAVVLVIAAVRIVRSHPVAAKA